MTTIERQPVFRQILGWSKNLADKRAVISPARSVTYGELASNVAIAANLLATRFDVSAGERVVLLADSHVDFVCAYLAVHNIGAICVPVDPQTTARSLTDIIERVSPKLLIIEGAVTTGAASRIGFEDLAGTPEQQANFESPGSADDRDADILFTSGTTGQTKGVVLSHRAIAAAAAHINAFVGTHEDSIEVLALPLSHSFGLGRIRCVLSVGATLVLTPGFLNGVRVIRGMIEHQATGFATVPAGIAVLLSDNGAALARLADQLEYIEIGSSPMPMEQKRRLMALLPRTRICMHYGLTEASRSAFLSFHDDADKLESIGRPSADVVLRIVDDSDNEVGNDIRGNVEVRGDHLMSRYWQDTELTAAVLHDGWLRTGDLGRRDADGYFYLEDRSSDMINVGGRKVAPLEIEQVLIGHPAVLDCAVVGVPDAQGMSGEMISAFMVANPAYGTPPKFSELAKLLRNALEPYKIPRQFTWIEKIPRSSSGKILRRQLRTPE